MENFEKMKTDGFCPKTQISWGTSENRGTSARSFQSRQKVSITSSILEELSA